MRAKVLGRHNGCFANTWNEISLNFLKGAQFLKLLISGLIPTSCSVRQEVMLKSNGKIIHNVLIAKSDMWEDQLQLNRLT